MPARKRTPRTCDAPGCDVPVRRGMLMCRDHWLSLPRRLREAINETWRQKRITAWSENCLEARRLLAGATPTRATAIATPTSSEAYAQLARRMGEQP